jgi:hypothetical protein
MSLTAGAGTRTLLLSSLPSLTCSLKFIPQKLLCCVWKAISSFKRISFFNKKGNMDFGLIVGQEVP